MQITKEKLAEAFRVWNERVQENPQGFDFNAVWQDSLDVANDSAEYFWNILEELNA